MNLNIIQIPTHWEVISKYYLETIEKLNSFNFPIYFIAIHISLFFDFLNQFNLNNFNFLLNCLCFYYIYFLMLLKEFFLFLDHLTIFYCVLFHYANQFQDLQLIMLIQIFMIPSFISFFYPLLIYFYIFTNDYLALNMLNRLYCFHL